MLFVTHVPYIQEKHKTELASSMVVNLRTQVAVRPYEITMHLYVLT
jgi:hypothetical protein